MAWSPGCLNKFEEESVTQKDVLREIMTITVGVDLGFPWGFPFDSLLYTI